jgi:manganese oxidase
MGGKRQKLVISWENRMWKFDLQPNYFTINGKALPSTESVYTSFGEKRMRFVNKSSTSHSMHVHDLELVELDVFPRNE